MIKRSMPPQITGLVFDLDGTAFPVQRDGLPSDAIIAATKAAAAKIFVSVATGRTLPYCSHIISKLGIRNVSIINGGTELYNPKTQKIVWKQALSPETLREIVGTLRSFHYKFTDDLSGDDLYEPAGYPVRTDVSKLVIFAVTEKDALSITRAVNRISGAEAHFMSSWTPNLWDIHITNELATKKHAMQALLARANLNHKTVMVVGDGGNDLPLFELAGWKVAMGNAEDRLKNAADYIAPSVEDDGLAEVINRFILNRI